MLASGCALWSGVAYKELFVQGAVPITVCPSQGPIVTAEALPLPALPDYEEGMETGVPLDERPKTSPPGGEPVRLGDGTMATEPMRSYAPSSPASTPNAGTPPAVEAPSPGPVVSAPPPSTSAPREPTPESSPSATPSPSLPL